MGQLGDGIARGDFGKKSKVMENFWGEGGGGY